MSNTTDGKKRITLVSNIIIFYRARSSILKSRWKRFSIIWKEFIAFVTSTIKNQDTLSRLNP